jgi:hypothetical protein
MTWLRLTERTKDRLTGLARVIVLIPMVILGNQVRLYVRGVWTDHGLNKDATTTSALITQVHPKRVFDYRYTVNGKEYTGTSIRAWEDEKVHQLQVGEKTTVFYSTSHPWLSSLQTLRVTWAALPFVVLFLLLELFLLAVLVDPKGRWSVSRWLLNT